MSELPVGDYGIVGTLALLMMGTFLWYVRAARQDLKDAHKTSSETIAQAHTDFTTYLKETASKQTEALVSVGNALQASIEQARAHEERANRRHLEVLNRLDDMESERAAKR